MFAARLRRSARGLALGAALAGAMACAGNDTGNSDTPDGYGDCQTRFDFTEKSNADPTSPAPGNMTVTGHFYSNESVIVRWTDANGQTQSSIDTPATDRTSITLGGLPSGRTHFLFTLSCPNGTHIVGFDWVTVK